MTALPGDEWEALLRLEARGGWNEADLNDFAILELALAREQQKDAEIAEWQEKAEYHQRIAAEQFGFVKAKNAEIERLRGAVTHYLTAHDEYIVWPSAPRRNRHDDALGTLRRALASPEPADEGKA